MSVKVFVLIYLFTVVTALKLTPDKAYWSYSLHLHPQLMYPLA
jgi:hypothetical protein